VDLIIFDFDGVLVDTAPDIADAANAALRHYGLPPVPVERVSAHIGGGGEALVQALLPPERSDLLDAVTARWREEYSRCYNVRTTLYPGVQQVLNQFYAAGKQMAIATNKIEALAQGLIRGLGLEPYISLVVGPESVVHRKPDPEAINLILGRLTVAPARALMVGDTASDIEAGKAAGVSTCGALYGYGAESDVARAHPDYMIRSLRELPDLIS
jgi:phosphoglycolate phosphatase